MGSRAQLNFGDCAVYALAALRSEPVLATGNDFAATDLTVLQL
jgi:ribonuclease VapC